MGANLFLFPADGIGSTDRGIRLLMMLALRVVEVVL